MMSLDLSVDEARAVVWDLIDWADVVIDIYPKGNG